MSQMNLFISCRLDSKAMGKIMKHIVFSIVFIALLLTSCKDKDTQSAELLQAAMDGDLKTVQMLLADGVDINIKITADGGNALLIASYYGHTDIVKLLLEREADVNVKNTDGVSALRMASQEGHTDIVKLLLERGADVNIKSTNGVTALMKASQNGHTDIVKLLLERGADVAATGVEWTALKLAKRMGHTEIVQLLEEAGATE